MPVVKMREVRNDPPNPVGRAYECIDIVREVGPGKSILIPNDVKNVSVTISFSGGAQGKIQTSTDTISDIETGVSDVWIDAPFGIVTVNTAAATDSLDRTAIYPASIIETANATDVVDRVAILTAEIIEAVSALDVLDRTIITTASITEIANAVDEVSTSGAAVSDSIVETANATDLVTATILAVRMWNGIHLVHRFPAQGDDVRIKCGAQIHGIPVIAATNDNAGAVRIFVNDVVKALKHG